MILLVGIGHVFRISDKIKYIIRTLRPDAVAVELDPQRLEILSNRDDYEPNPDAPLGLRMLSKFQESIAERYGTHAGEEMLAALDGAKEIGVPGLLIDTMAMDMILKVWGDMSLTKKAKLIGGLLGVKFLPGIGGKGKTIEEELEDFEADPDEFMNEFEKEFPELKKALVDDRNIYMAEALVKAHQVYKHIIAVVGAGHISGMENILRQNGIEVDILHLTEVVLKPEEFLPAVEKIRKKWTSSDGNVDYSFSFEYDDG